MRLLDRYLLRELMAPLAYCLSGFLIFWLTFVLFSELDEFQRNHLKPLDVALYLFYTLPKMLGYVVPLGLLLAMLYALTNHARHNELTAIRGAGVSLWRLLVPYLLVGGGCGLSLFLVNEILMPDSADDADRVLESRQTAQNTNLIWHKDVTFIRQVKGRTNVVGPFNFHRATEEMSRAWVEWHYPQGGWTKFFAERGVYSNGCWHFFEVQESRFRPGERVPSLHRTNYLSLPELNDPPRRIRSEIKIGSMSDLKAARGMSLSLGEILEYKRWHPARDPKLDTKFQVRLAAPATCLIVVLIAVPFAAGSGRRNVFVGVASSVFIAFTYFVVQRFGEAAGMGDKIAPWLAGWLPNLLFGALGILMTSRTR
jgi:lipopolysaccharide export system permease protein